MKIFILFCFICANSYSQDRLYASKSDNGKMGLVDNMGTFIVSPNYDLITDLDNQQNHDWAKTRLFIAKKDSLFGVFDYSGKTILNTEYQYIDCRKDTCFVKKNNLMGLTNVLGKIIIPFQYANISLSSENKFQVQNKDGLWGYINKKNELIIPFQFSENSAFTSGRAKICKNKNTNKEMCGFIDEKGKMIIPQKFNSSVGDFHNGLASFWGDNGKYGFIDKFGKVAIQPKHINVNDFSYGTAEVSLECFQFDDYGNCNKTLINRFGKSILPKNALIDRSFKEENFTVISNTKTHNQGMINNSGKIIVPLLYQDVGNIEGNYITVMDNSSDNSNLLGLYNKNGKLIFSPKYDQNFFNFEDNFIFLSLPNDEVKGVLNSNGKIIIPFKYESIIYQDGVFCVKKANNLQFSYLNKFGKPLNNSKFYFEATPFENGLATVLTNKGNEIINKKEQIIYSINDDYALVSLKNGFIILFHKKLKKLGMLNLIGNTVIPFEYDALKFLNNEFLLAKKLNKFGIINLKNETIISTDYLKDNFYISKDKIRYIGDENKNQKEIYFDLKGNKLPNSVAFDSFYNQINEE